MSTNVELEFKFRISTPLLKTGIIEIYFPLEFTHLTQSL